MISKLMTLGLFAALVALLSRHFRAKAAASVFTALFVIVPAFIPPNYGVALLGTIPLSIVVFPIMLFIFRYVESHRGLA